MPGELQSVADFARHLTEDTISIPGKPQYYINYHAMACGLKINHMFKVELCFEQAEAFCQHCLLSYTIALSDFVGP